MGVRKAKERGKMARNSETAVTRCQLQDSVAVGSAGQPSSAEGAQYMQLWEVSPSTGGGGAVQALQHGPYMEKQPPI
jgi:hypothetical protein